MNTIVFLQNLERMFAVEPPAIRNMIGDFHAEMKNGLAGKTSSLKMLPSFVKRPSGTESGRFLALDLGGTNMRLLSVHLDGNGGVRILAMAKFAIEKKLMQGPGSALFGFIAQCIVDFLKKNRISPGAGLPLAFTFSFPVEQTGIAAGRLIAWTKGFTAAGVVGQNVVALLEKALVQKGLQSIRIAALVNDTVGTLVAKCYSERLCDMGVILGTGTNACYPEQIANIAKNKNLGENGEMIVNMEWGNFARLKQTPYDIELDKYSPNPGFHFLEKMTSGMFLGALTSRIVSQMELKELSAAFRNGQLLKTEHMSLIAGGNFDMLPELGLNAVSAHDKEVLKNVCRIVAHRSARLAGMAIAAVITWMDPKLEREHLAGIDGSLFELYPGYKEDITGVFHDILGENASKIRLEMAKDGSGIGAAIIAAIATANK